MLIFRVNLGMQPLKLIILEKQACSRVSTHIYSASKDIGGKNINFLTKTYAFDLSNWSSQKNEPCSEGFNTHLLGFSRDIWENIHF